MNKYNKKVKKAAMKKTCYSSVKTKITKELTANKKKVVAIKNSQNEIKNNMAKCIVKVELYHNVYKDLEFIISGINKTNAKLRVKKIIDDVIDKHIPSNMKAKFSNIKKDLEELLNASKLDVSEVKNKILVAAKNRIYNNILAQAEELYKKAYFRVGKSYFKRAFTTGEIAKWLRNKNSIVKLESFTNKLTVASNVINKVDKVVKMSARAVKVFDSYSKGDGLLQEQDRLKTSKDYKEYYYKVAQEASKMASILKSFSSKLPMGMRDYYEFIFTVAENTDKMAKVVYDYTTKLESAMAELDKESSNFGKKDYTSGRDALKFDNLDKYYKYRGK